MNPNDLSLSGSGAPTGDRLPVKLSDRQERIADMVRDADFLDVETLAGQFNVTTQTIRRDLNVLCDYGLARRRHGGVERPSTVGNLAYSSRQILNTKEKRTIAQAVARLVPNGASLAFSIGTTPELVAEALLGHEGLRIFTNNLNVAMLACTNRSFQVTVAGGTIRNGDRDVLGPEVERFFSGYRVDFGIFGVAGIEEDGALLDFSQDEVLARQAIRQHSRESFLVADFSKFSRRAHVRGGQIEDADHFFCDSPPPAPIVDRLAATGVALTVGDGGQP
ncbi:MAG: DeoR/GlpR family DNA-binding transcription regulator [Alphaproteobacteria bacterium]|nr:DeoR/GlpR family DNA-binding transcription regulator [Alphaproteobacteria bacterium]